MRKIILLSFITLDGVMQAPGGPGEDNSGGFAFGGWVAPYFDETAGKLMEQQMKPRDLLLGRKTFDIFESYWPKHHKLWPGINDVTKYVVSNSRKASRWQNSVFIDSLTGIVDLKNSSGSELLVHGSSQLAQTLLEHDLVDELWLKFFPVTLGSGKKLFGNGTIPAAFKLIKNTTTPSGVVFSNYARAGEVKTGIIGG